MAGSTTPSDLLGSLGIGAPPSVNGGSTTGIQYLGEVPHARIYTPDPRGTPYVNIESLGYKKGDQIKLLPAAGQSLSDLQTALYNAGYLTDADMQKIRLGSPDTLTTNAFAKLLATSNLSGMDWQSSLSARLNDTGAQPPSKAREVPPLTIALTNPDDIKATLQKSAQSLLGGYMSEDQANLFTSQFQQLERQSQTQAQYQKYDPASAAAGTGIYGPGGETTSPPDLGVAAENYAKAADPLQYQATQIGAGVSSALDKLRTTGYL